MSDTAPAPRTYALYTPRLCRCGRPLADHSPIKLARLCAYRAGFTLREVGALTGCTGERVRQIVAKCAPPEERRSTSEANAARLPLWARNDREERLARARDLAPLCGATAAARIFDVRVSEKIGRSAYVLSRTALGTRWREILRLWNAGWTYREIGEELNVGKGYIGVTLARARRAGVEVRRGRRENRKSRDVG